MGYNQGWQSYIKCNQVLQDIYAGKSTEIDCTIIEEAWLNYNLSKACRIFDGILFEQQDYPKDTRVIYQIVQDHLSTLR
jgi:hypothetical protein